MSVASSSRIDQPRLSTDVLQRLDERLGRLSGDALSDVSEDVYELIRDHPEQSNALLEAYVGRLFDESPSKAIEFAFDQATLTQDSRAAFSLVSEMLKKWNADDAQAVMQHFQSIFDDGDASEYRNRDLLSFLIRPDEGEVLNSKKWLSWAQSSRGESTKTTELEGAALDVILRQIDTADPLQFGAISQSYVQRLADPAMQKYLDEYVSVVALNYPNDTRELLKGIPHSSYREQILERTMSELGGSHPEVAAEWLSAPDVIDEIFRPLSFEFKKDSQGQDLSEEQIKNSIAAYEAEANMVFDRSLTAYIFSLVQQHPEDALATVDAMIDEERREKLRGEVLNLVEVINNSEDQK